MLRPSAEALDLKNPLTMKEPDGLYEMNATAPPCSWLRRGGVLAILFVNS